MAPRPDLYPLETPKHLAFPSELQEPHRSANPTSTRCDGKGPSVPPPLAYTEFLKALSPTYGSPPQSAGTPYSASYPTNKQLPSPPSHPSTASTSSFPLDTVPPSSKARTHMRTHSASSTPLYASRSAVDASHYRRMRMSPTHYYSPVGAVDSPKSAHPVHSPYPPVERKVRYVESPSGVTSRSITIQHVVTHTVTLKRVPSLAAPPKGKRRRMPVA
ncbi:uncharacterized protein BDV14DRAFT_176723 [Aspergillus stella-maris]|uniref:uncharacterized protein n=1 Tax=Aspergillus stella-maris TaxID=1810926 RepID=UPI003CCE4DD5